MSSAPFFIVGSGRSRTRLLGLIHGIQRRPLFALASAYGTDMLPVLIRFTHAWRTGAKYDVFPGKHAAHGEGRA